MKNGFVLVKTMQNLHRPKLIDLSERAWDFFRVSSLELCAHEIKSKGTEGNVAELGVYQGDFATKINEAFPERTLYLFDTFDGFDKRDLETDRTMQYSKGEHDFSNTSVDGVLKKMKHPHRCVIRKGYFPDSAAGIEDRFAFVSIDVDLYAPMLAGLGFFFPRLVPGGYIFVHDFNNDEFKGVREAVVKYCDENGAPYFPLSDNWGSAIIIK